jgi:uncharacterized protein (TIGR02271 family)
MTQDKLNLVILRDAAGQTAVIQRSDQQDVVEARLDDGRIIRLPASEVTPLDDGNFLARVRFDAIAAAADSIVVPVIEEQVTVSRRVVEAGRVRITKTVHTDEAHIDEPLLHEVVQVDRQPVNEFVDEAPPMRTEGDTLIVPLVEEVLVVEKRLLVREELRITRQQTEKRHAETVTLRREDAHVERLQPDQARSDHQGEENP